MENKNHSDKRYPAVKPHHLTGLEPVADKNLISYWSWAHSNLLDNAERGILAEYLVHLAVGETSATRVNWDKYDMISPEGITIEVKASGYLQSWAQDRLSTIRFSIRPTHGWSFETNTYGEKCIRQSDVYVFCLLSHTDQDSVNPLDISQWEFYVLSTSVLNKKAGRQKSISLSHLIELGAYECDYWKLKEAIIAAHDNERK